MIKYTRIKLIAVAVIISCSWQILHVDADQCKPEGSVYGHNDIVDQLLTCSIATALDLDLTPQGEYMKSTPKTLIEQGFSNKTSILYVRLSGLWTAKRPRFVETAWQCDGNRTVLNTIVEFNGLSLEVVERVEIPLYRNKQKLAIHKPCLTFDLPVWMCRQSKPMYKTTKTWVNHAYFNLTLIQASNAQLPIIEDFSSMFTCPESFKQTITYSPSAMYVLSKYMQTQESVYQPIVAAPRNRRSAMKSLLNTPVTHPISFATSKDGRSMSVPGYQSFVSLILGKVKESLASDMSDCIQAMDLNLSLLVDNNSFSQYRYKDIPEKQQSEPEIPVGSDNQCSNKVWLKNRIELANAAKAADQKADQASSDAGSNPSKRSHPSMLNYPKDSDQLLNPYAYYRENN